VSTLLSPGRHADGTSVAAGRMTSAAAAVGWLTALVLVYLVAVWTPLGQVVDTSLMRGALALRGEWSDEVLDAVSPATLLVAGGLAVVLGGGSWGTRGALRAGVTVVATVVASQVLKAVLPRPTWFDDALNSLPSGHVAAVAGLAVATAYAAPPAVRAPLGVLGAVTTALVGLATLAEQWHRPSDVIASVLLAAAVGAAVHLAPATSRTRPETTR